MKKILPIALLGIFALTGCNSQDSKISKADVMNAFYKEAFAHVANPYGLCLKKEEIPTEAIKNYPSKFDLRRVDTNMDGRSENYITGVKDQSPFGTCWAFGAMAAAESSILYDMKRESVRYVDNTPRDAIDLSERHTAWFDYTPMPSSHKQAGEGLFAPFDGVDEHPSYKFDSGSTVYSASSLFASGIGPVIEPDSYSEEGRNSDLNYHGKNMDVIESSTFSYYSPNDDWSVPESKRFMQSFALKSCNRLPVCATFDNGVYDIDFAETTINCYKEQLMDGRALAIAYSADNSYLYGETAYVFFNPKTSAHYTFRKELANHAVTVVGWDDNYSKNNFLTTSPKVENDEIIHDDQGEIIYEDAPLPPKDGAWICKNSWGGKNSISDGLNKYDWGDDGYFYISYYDQTLSDVFSFDFDLDRSFGENDILQHDFLPLQFASYAEVGFPVSEANIFRVEENKIITDVTCVTNETNADVTISFYKVDAGKINFKKRISTFETNVKYPGYHMVPLEKTIEVNKGEEIAVAVKEKAGDKYLLGIASEFNQKAFDEIYSDIVVAGNGVVNKGESFVVINNNETIDLKDIKNELEGPNGDAGFLTYDNFKIKLNTKNA